MTLPAIFAGVLVMTAVFSVFNDSVLKLHRTIGVMFLALLMSVFLLMGIHFHWPYSDEIRVMIGDLNFGETLIHGMLGALLFAGAINIDFDELHPRLFVITVLAIAGVLISTFVVGLIIWGLVALMGLHLPLVYCLTFGALISPTDPIAVLAILRSIGVSKGLDMDVCGESLFNDGIGFVVFTFFFTLAVKSETMGVGAVTLFFLKSVGGGAVLAALCSYAAYYMVRMAADSHVEILITLALVFGSFEAADAMEFSPAITIVIVGLLFGRLCHKKMRLETREALHEFWGVIDEVLNTLLFVMVGLLLVIVPINSKVFILGVAAIIIVLFGRWVSVLAPVAVLQKWFYFSPRSVRILTWGGLRGGLPIAMALTLPAGPYRDLILWMTYAVVVFSILVQGTTIGKLAGSRTTKADEYRHPELSENADNDRISAKIRK